LQDPVVLETQNLNCYNGAVLLPANIDISVLEYRITATDKSVNGNIKSLPAEGFYTVSMVNSQQPVTEFSTDFENNANDFVTADFNISEISGFNSKVLHSTSPYATSALENENCNLIAQLVHPVVVKDNGIMSFDEVVLVEPGETEALYTDELFWDYVIVEASKNFGKSWLPLTQGYDSGADAVWYNAFTSNLKSNVSTASGTEEMFLKQSINLTENTELTAGDTILIRFRLASDNSVNGWGWAIDNLEIQKNAVIAEENSSFTDEVSVFPNPFQNSFYVDCSAANSFSSVDIEVTDMFGKTVFRNAGINPAFDEKVQVDLSASSAGIYLVNIRHGNSIISTNKLVKN
ncbi:MAG TPA: T9SS type A sorting domain-containing protein, partial [Prolixibacteraceae bacterium]|nr:T9SS type A sorting domain-containing protein [Prolixibacteraceae bacterium]